MGSNTTTTAGAPTSSAPWPGVVPYINQGLQSDQALYNSNSSGVAPLNQVSTDAFAQANDFAGNTENRDRAYLPYLQNLQTIQSGGIQSQAQPMLDTLQGITQTGNADQYQGAKDIYNSFANGGPVNPFLNDLLDANATRIGNRAASLSSGAGRYGSAGMYDALNRSIAETNNPILSAAYENDQGRKLQAAQGLGNIASSISGNQLNAGNTGLQYYTAAGNRAAQASAMAPSLFQLGAAPGQMRMGLADFLQQRDQADNPWTALGRYGAGLGFANQLLAGSGEKSGTTSTTSTPTPWTTYAGLGLAGAGLLSDVRAKTDIEHVGRDPTGLNMYKYRYKGQPKATPKFVGPMAQEVAQRNPEQVGREPWTGFLYIKGQR
jgi:hypothetical protein